MSRKSNDNGRAYEYACLINLEAEISKIRSCVLVKNSSYHAAYNAWCTLTENQKRVYHISSLVAVAQIFELEPRITESATDVVEILIQPDSKGKTGDVRDILIVRSAIAWEIGLSLKHNHYAVKHNRLSHRLDFGEKWYGYPCSEEYWNAIKPVFDYLGEMKKAGAKFSELPNKDDDVYVPVLKAFMSEIERQCKTHKDLTVKMVEYLLGKYDFYKVMSDDRKKETDIVGFNLHGTLNLASSVQKSEFEVPIVVLPTRIVHIGFVPDSKNTIELYMDGGWQFTFRIHNGDDKIIKSLKFDIQIVGMPTAVFTIKCHWN